MATIETFSTRASLCGYVTDAVTGTGIARADVELPARGQLTSTREDGFFFFIDLPAGQYTLQISTPLLPGRYAAASVTGVTVQSDSSGRPVFDARANTVLPPTRVAGTIRDGASTKPIIGATVRLRAGEQAAASDKNGQYVLSPLQPGTATVQVSAPGYQGATRSVTLAPGQQTAADFNLTKA